jgi:hypothetical protein
MAEKETFDHADVVEWCIKLYPGAGDSGPECRESEAIRQAPPKWDGTS